MVLMEHPPKHRPHDSARSPLQFVDPERYCELAISMRPLQRCDDPESGLRVLVDVRTGDRFAIEDARLTKYLASRI